LPRVPGGFTNPPGTKSGSHTFGVDVSGLAAGEHTLVARAYQGNPTRYEYFLTKKGKGLEPVLEAILAWGQKHYPGTKRFPRVEHR